MKMSREKWEWVTLMLITIVVICGVFVQSRYIPLSQEFGPVEVSSLGGQSPFRVIMRLECGSEDGSYLSDVSDVYCKLLVRSQDQYVQAMRFSLLITNTTNQTVASCVSTIENINPVLEKGGYCLDEEGRTYFELPKGDYQVAVKKFSIPGGEIGVEVTKAKPVVFRGELHVMSEFERRTRVSGDGTSLATFAAFIFIVPTTFIAVRSFLQESPSNSNRKTHQRTDNDKRTTVQKNEDDAAPGHSATGHQHLLDLMYDAQLKKMLAYIAAAISSFGAQLTVFFFAVQRSATLPVLPTFVLAILLWLSQCYFAVAIVTKYHELMILENKLDITNMHAQTYPSRPVLAKMWDRLHRQSLGIGPENYKRMNLLMDLGTALVLILVTILFGYIMMTMFA